MDKKEADKLQGEIKAYLDEKCPEPYFCIISMATPGEKGMINVTVLNPSKLDMQKGGDGFVICKSILIGFAEYTKNHMQGVFGMQQAPAPMPKGDYQ